LPLGVELIVFVCDDGSKDGTGEMLATEFPQVNVVQGNGSLFWNGGTNLAWNKAKDFGNFDFFLWLNDDTYLRTDALLDLFGQYDTLQEPAIITGACSDPKTDKFSFGGTTVSGPVIPNGSLQEVNLINGNLVLIPAEIEKELNGLSLIFTHYLGDYDYGLRAQAKGWKCYTSANYLAECEINELPYWGDSKLGFSQRWKLVHYVKGLALSEYYQFLKIHKGRMQGLKTLLSVYLRVFAPSLFFSLKKSLR
jgi:GT2 family glycosyltransferase